MRAIPATKRQLTIGEVAVRSGFAVSALRFYESAGLIDSERTKGNQRRYARDVLRRLAFIRVSQRLGVPLGTIREALDRLPGQRSPSRADWARLSAAWREDLNRRIQQLEGIRDHLDDCIGCGCLSLDRCKLANREDELGKLGPGAHRHLSVD